MIKQCKYSWKPLKIIKLYKVQSMMGTPVSEKLSNLIKVNFIELIITLSFLLARIKYWYGIYLVS